MNTPVIIALTGLKGAGKSTAADRLETELRAAGRPVLRLAVAAPLKDACVFLLDMLEPLMDSVEAVRPADNADWVNSAHLKETLIPGCHHLTARRLMQEVGEAVKRAAGINLWAGLAAAEARAFFANDDLANRVFEPVVIVDDLRFIEEFVALHGEAPIRAFRRAGGRAGDPHRSENESDRVESAPLTPDYDDADFAWLNPVRAALGLAPVENAFARATSAKGAPGHE